MAYVLPSTEYWLHFFVTVSFMTLPFFPQMKIKIQPSVTAVVEEDIMQ